MRALPEISSSLPPAKRPISFICVKYSTEFYHNLAKSNCVNSDLNELIVVENTNNLFYQTLGQAINAGIAKSTNDLLVIVHEDVFLPQNWQSMFEQSLQELEKHDKSWLVAGTSGWDTNNVIKGFVNEPSNSIDSWRMMHNTDSHFNKATLLCSSLLAVRKSTELFPDPNLPRHHHIGIDLAMRAHVMGKPSYILNAPTAHQYANEAGKLINNTGDSIKLPKKEQLGYLAGRACADEYITDKWPGLDSSILHFEQPGPFVHARAPDTKLHTQGLTKSQTKTLKSPIILLAKGGGGSRLMSVLANDVDLFIGNDVNPTGDSREMARAIYRAIFRKYASPDNNNDSISEEDLTATARELLENADWPTAWAFKVPESLFLLPIMNRVFPDARYVFMSRDPLSISLRGTHMTSDSDNPIGQIALVLAYDSMNIPRQNILIDDKPIRLARTTSHQLTMVTNFKQFIETHNWLSLKFEDLLSRPLNTLGEFSNFIGISIKSTEISTVVDTDRATIEYSEHSDETVAQVNAILKPIRYQFGYDKT